MNECVCSECSESFEFLISIPSRYGEQHPEEWLCEECYERELEPYGAEEWSEEF